MRAHDHHHDGPASLRPKPARPHAPDAAAAARTAAAGRWDAASAGGLLGLQRAAGNRATLDLMRRSSGGSASVGLPDKAGGDERVPGLAPGASVLNEASLESKPLGVPGLSRPASPAPVQRRTPGRGEIAGLGTDPKILKKLRKTVLRTYADLPAAAQTAIVAGLPGQTPLLTVTMAGYVSTASAANLTNLIGAMETASRGPGGHAAGEPSLVEHPGAAQTFVPWKTFLTDPTHQATFETLVSDVQTLIRAAGNDDNAIKRVFGDAELSQAKPRFEAAAKRVGELLQDGKIGADLSGEAAQLKFGGLTSTERMLFSRDFFDDLKAGGAGIDDCRHTLCHETFHTAHDSIQHNGGYRHEEEFAYRQAAEKLQNAEHFVEVVAQVKWSVATRTLRPRAAEGATGATGTRPALDDTGTAQKANADQLRNAWVMALNIHGRVTDAQKRQRKLAEYDAAQATKKGPAWLLGSAASLLTRPRELSDTTKDNLTLYSRLLGLTIHNRIPPPAGGASPAYPMITDLDLALSEGVTRRLGEAYARSNSLPKTDVEWVTKFPGLHLPATSADIQNHLLEAALGGDRVRKTLTRDKEMVKVLTRWWQGDDAAKPAANYVLPK